MDHGSDRIMIYKFQRSRTATTTEKPYFVVLVLVHVVPCPSKPISRELSSPLIHDDTPLAIPAFHVCVQKNALYAPNSPSPVTLFQKGIQISQCLKNAQLKESWITNEHYFYNQFLGLPKDFSLCKTDIMSLQKAYMTSWFENWTLCLICLRAEMHQMRGGRQDIWSMSPRLIYVELGLLFERWSDRFS